MHEQQALKNTVMLWSTGSEFQMPYTIARGTTDSYYPERAARVVAEALNQRAVAEPRNVTLGASQVRLLDRIGVIAKERLLPERLTVSLVAQGAVKKLTAAATIADLAIGLHSLLTMPSLEQQFAEAPSTVTSATLEASMADTALRTWGDCVLAGTSSSGSVRSGSFCNFEPHGPSYCDAGGTCSQLQDLELPHDPVTEEPIPGYLLHMQLADGGRRVLHKPAGQNNACASYALQTVEPFTEVAHLRANHCPDGFGSFGIPNHYTWGGWVYFSEANGVRSGPFGRTNPEGSGRETFPTAQPDLWDVELGVPEFMEAAEGEPMRDVWTQTQPQVAPGVTMPQCRGGTVSVCRDELLGLGFQAGRITTTWAPANDPDVANGAVVYTTPPAGTQGIEPAQQDVVITRNPAPAPVNVTVPQCGSGSMTYAQCAVLIEDAGLVPQRQECTGGWPPDNWAFPTAANAGAYCRHEDDPIGSVEGTVPCGTGPFGAPCQAPHGSTVDVYVNTAPEPDPDPVLVEVPFCDHNDTYQECGAKLDLVGLTNHHRVEVGMAEAVLHFQAGAVLQTQPAGGQMVAPETEVEVTTNPDPERMPVLVPAPNPGETYWAYIDRLRDLGLLGRLEWADPLPDRQPTEVTQVVPNPGTRVVPGTTVTVRAQPWNVPRGRTGQFARPAAPSSPGPRIARAASRPAVPELDFSPLAIDAGCDRFPWGVPCWTFDAVSSWAGAASPPDFVIPFRDTELRIRFDQFDPAMAIVRPILLVVGTLGIGWGFFALVTGRRLDGDGDDK